MTNRAIVVVMAVVLGGCMTGEMPTVDLGMDAEKGEEQRESPSERPESGGGEDPIPHDPHELPEYQWGPTGACACTTLACVVSWVRTNMGCGRCITFQCPSPQQDWHACVPCSCTSCHGSVQEDGDTVVWNVDTASR